MSAVGVGRLCCGVHAQVNDTDVTPYDSIGLLARQNANSISK